MNMLYCIEHEEMVKAQKGNPTPFIHEFWVETDLGAWTKKEIDFCEFPMGYAFCPPPPSLAEELDAMPFEEFEAWCDDNSLELQNGTLIQDWSFEMDYKKLFDEWASSKPDEQISYATAFQLLDFVEWLNKRASQQSVQADGAYWSCKNCGDAIHNSFDICGNCGTPRS